MTEIRQDPSSFSGDETTESKVLMHVLKLVEDKISEVKNQAVKWYTKLSISQYTHIRCTDTRKFGRTHQDCTGEPDGVHYREAHRFLGQQR